MKISVVIPVYNEENNLRSCLESIMHQTRQPDEIIVVDNNCTDHSVAIAQEFPVKVVRETKQGIGYARNRGFNTARFEIIARTDADSIVPSHWIEQIARNFDTAPIDALAGLYYFPDSRWFYNRPWHNLVSIYIIKFLTVVQLQGPNMSLRASLWEKIRPLVHTDEEGVLEDLDLSLQIKKVGGIIKLDTALIVKSAGRRLEKKPWSFMVEYPFKSLKTIFLNLKKA